MNSFQKGDLSEAKFISKLLELGYNVLIPFSNSSRYDAVIEKDNSFKSIQIKTGRLKDGGIDFNSCSNNKGYKRKSYHGEVDYIGIYCPETNNCYLVPTNITGKATTRLRLNPTKNNQSKNILFATNYELQ